MAFEAPSSNHDPLGGLPPVAPPSGKYIFQLFVVPGIIVLGIVVFFLALTGAVRWLVGGPSNPEQFLKNLDNANPEIRWRAAEDLAQVLLRDDQLASNPKFALDLADRLRQVIQSSKQAEEDLANHQRGKPADEVKNENRTLEPEQNYIRYLSASLGNFTIPVGVPLLRQLAEKQDGLDPKAVARRRWQAIWSLANLGENLKRSDKLSADRQNEIIADLETESSSGPTERRDEARLTLDYLKARQAGRPPALGVDETLAKCAQDDNPFLRAIVAFALNFWEGDAKENARMETTLVQLANDVGRGEQLVDQFFDEDERQAEAIVKKPGSRVRYNATVALARRGSDKVRLGVLLEMLDEDVLRDNFRRKQKDGQEVADEAVVSSTLTNALKAVAKLHQKRPEFDLSKVQPQVDKLMHSPNPAVRKEAEEARIILGNT